nr:YlzJ-like family protein [Caldalkalibacillus salinus]
MPLEHVFDGYDTFNPDYEEIVHQGVNMLIEPCGVYQGRIVRLLSTDPQDFLNPDYSPGQVIHFRSS